VLQSNIKENYIMDIKNTNLYKYAAQNKLRFPTRKGNLSVEDLFMLSPEDLDSLYKALTAERKNTSEESLLNAANPANEALDVRIELVRDVFNTKKAEQAKRVADRANAAKTREKIQNLKNALAAKENEALASKSADELRAMLDELQAGGTDTDAN
jgi:hypothetical protein